MKRDVRTRKRDVRTRKRDVRTRNAMAIGIAKFSLSPSCHSEMLVFIIFRKITIFYVMV